MKAKLIDMCAGRSGKLYRWECPNCRKNFSKVGECRFNLDPKRTGKRWPCKFCKTILELVK